MAAHDPLRTDALVRLRNEAWGFESNCFVCEPRNEVGLRIPFFHDPDRDVVVAELELGDDFSGAPSYVHGGISLAVLDEAQAWATIAIAGRFAVTTETTTRFARPVLVGRRYRVEARVVEADDDTIRTEGTISFAPDKVCASAAATFAVLSAATAVGAIGVELTGEDARYLKPGP